MKKSGKDHQILQRNLEEDNEAKIDELYNQVNHLKGVSQDINAFLSEDKSMLNQMDGQYSSNQNLMAGAMEKIDELLNSNVGKNYCFLIIVVLCFFIILYFLK
ncbi:hypothetical protein PPERSA_11189 [Pseudocohnilembus persalinus]|uniref:t-SNARE coiled-coil homology domain-containing protein n=1 Tax=Pseudocohnilembus persalinus TaxID=266149 RepID=A0A0V0R0F5_PSEPJ|nr:hypothetical protein PPERSA_11189 [Pseudocohnilembus persalinus]|eukprot:KRX07640.1 hypothetical protein PPERSA_11189 [Pseudocohnilembus persalinus]